ncbi:MAG TPA: hypothetical protein VEM15_01970 [Thermodesulfobacteriota bacterium]|nr:hypothetical protein [Thermodesulfobacteriota bacterium]
MRKTLWLTGLVLLFVSVQGSFAFEPSKPFQIAKDWALVGDKTESGGYWYRVVRTINRQQEEYSVRFVPKYKYMGEVIGGTVTSKGKSVVVMFDKATGDYVKGLYEGQHCLAEITISQEEADNLMNDILDHLVQKYAGF